MTTMSSSDLMDIAFDKRKEIQDIMSRPYITEDTVWVIETECDNILSTIKTLEWENKRRYREMMTGKEEEESIESIKARIDILQVIWSCIDLSNKPRGRNIKCPFASHNDKTASFAIFERTNAFLCFWCHKWWSSIDFLMHYYNVSLSNAIQLLKKF